MLYVHVLSTHLYPFLVRDSGWALGVFFIINNQLKSMTTFFIVFCPQQAMMWMYGHVVLIE
jgi:hypothetical protein